MPIPIHLPSPPFHFPPIPLHINPIFSPFHIISCNPFSIGIQDSSASFNFEIRWSSLLSLQFSSEKKMAGDDLSQEVEKRGGEEEAAKEEEDTGAQIAPIVKLEAVAVTTGEEDETALLDMKAKLYRFDKDGNQWKERGVGTVKLLKHKETGKVRLVMRQAKTLKICANHLVLPSTSLQEHAGNDKSCVWHATDFSDGELKEELFCVRFATVDNAKKFRDTVEEIAEAQAKKSEAVDESEELDEAAEALNDLKVEDQKEDAKDVKEEEKEKGEKPGTKAEENEEKPETKAEVKKVVEKLETTSEEKEVVDKPETKAEEKEVVEKPETIAEEKEVVEKLEEPAVTKQGA